MWSKVATCEFGQDVEAVGTELGLDEGPGGGADEPGDGVVGWHV